MTYPGKAEFSALPKHAEQKEAFEVMDQIRTVVQTETIRIALKATTELRKFYSKVRKEAKASKPNGTNKTREQKTSDKLDNNHDSRPDKQKSGQTKTQKKKSNTAQDKCQASFCALSLEKSAVQPFLKASDQDNCARCAKLTKAEDAIIHLCKHLNSHVEEYATISKVIQNKLSI